MGAVTRFAAAIGFAGAVAALCAFPAEAGCKRMAFSVNDYGKDGPTKDSQDLLDKHIATWAAEQGIEKYTVGKKDVSCELFLNLIVVDEHTCTARATVCWGGDKVPATQDAKAQEAKKKDAAKTAKADSTGDGAAAAKPEEAKDAKPAEAKAAEATPPATPASDNKPAAQVETGALPLTNKSGETSSKTADTAEKPAGDSFSVSERDAVAAAAAAAERAAAAAERAAAAAERAAAAATEANAARAQAVSGSNSSSTGSVAAPEPPAYGAASQPIVAPIQPDATKQ
jgi:hypothetical protein